MAVITKLPVPTGDTLMAAVGGGRDACDLWRKRISSWNPVHAVPQLVMNALDPALLELILGPDASAGLIPLLRSHYRSVRERFPGPFADVEQVWRVQRAWWLQFVEVDEDDPPSGGALAARFRDTDLLAPNPGGWLTSRVTGPSGGVRPLVVSRVRT